MLLDLAACPPLLAFYEEMKSRRDEYPADEYEARRTLPTPQKAWYDGEAVYEVAFHIQQRWYGTTHDHGFQVGLRARLMQIGDPETIEAFASGDIGYEQGKIFEIYLGRAERWRQLAAHCGVPAPSAFRLYRAQPGPEVARAVVDAWSRGLTEFRLDHRGLSAWSLLEGHAATGARTHLATNARGALAPATVPLEDTFLDVLVDDGYFARRGIEEAEVVVGIGDPALDIVCDALAARVKVAGVEYGPERASEAGAALRNLDAEEPRR